MVVQVSPPSIVLLTIPLSIELLEPQAAKPRLLLIKLSS
jgi:hypothetical protein